MKLSIIVTVFKAERYIQQCVRSFYQQDFPAYDFEVIIVDNHTPDKSVEIVRKMQQEYSNLRIVHLAENHYAGGGRNAGLNEAKGELVLFVDADDFLYPDVLGKLVREWDVQDLDFVHFDSDALVNGTIVKGPETQPTNVMAGTDLMFESGLRWQDHVVVWRKVFSKKFLDDNDLRFVEDIVFDDDDFAFRSYAKAKRVKHINLHAYVNRCNNDSASHTNVGFPLIKCFMVQSDCLIQLIKQYEKADLNPNFIPAIESLVRYNLSESLHHYDQMPDVESRRLIIKAFLDNMRLCRYVSKRKLIKFIMSSILKA